MASDDTAPARIPLTVIGGFLGAGKTTLLNRVLTRSARRAAVLVNDFGPIDVDAGLVARHDGDTISLSNGCVCCSIGSGLEDALCRVLALDPPPQWIVIEASGVSDPARIAQVGMADPALQLESVVVVADAAQLRAQADDPLLSDTVRRQIDSAGLLILNKTDLVTPDERVRLRAWLDGLAPGLPMVEAVESDVDIEQTMTAATLAERDIAAGLLPPRDRQQAPRGPGQAREHAHPRDQGHDHGHDHGHGHAAHPHDDPDHPFVSWLWPVDRDVSADALAAALKRLPRGVIRAKGWVRSDRHGAVLVQYAGRRVRFDTRTPPPVPLRTGLVLIGLRAAADPQATAEVLDTALRPGA